MKYASDKCKICHGDISLNNIVINRIWNDDEGDDYIDNDIDDIDITRIKRSDDDSASNVDIDEKFTESDETADSGNNSDSELTSLLSSSLTKTMNQPSTSIQPSTSNSGSSTIKAYGLVIDYDNSFSLDEMSEDRFKIHSVRHSPMLYVLHLTLC